MKKKYIIIILLFIIGFIAFGYFYRPSYKTVKQAIFQQHNYSPFSRKDIKKIYEFENEAFVIDESIADRFVYFYKKGQRWYDGLADSQRFDVENSGVSFEDLNKGKSTVEDYFKEGSLEIQYYKSKRSNRIYIDFEKNTSVEKNTCKEIVDSKDSDFYISCKKHHISIITVVELKKGEDYWINIKGVKYNFTYDTWKYSIG